jgi:hypothetical protein
MKENINYSSPEGQGFQEKPHISIMKSREFPKTWQIDLRWREDSSSKRIDAEFNFVDGYAPFSAAVRAAFWYADVLNVPIAKYEDNFIRVLQKPIKPSTPVQSSWLKFLENSEAIRRFPTH